MVSTWSRRRWLGRNRTCPVRCSDPFDHCRQSGANLSLWRL